MHFRGGGAKCGSEFERESRDLRHPVRYLYRSIIIISSSSGSSSRHKPREKERERKRSRSIWARPRGKSLAVIINIFPLPSWASSLFPRASYTFTVQIHTDSTSTYATSEKSKQVPQNNVWHWRGKFGNARFFIFYSIFPIFTIIESAIQAFFRSVARAVINQ